MSNPLAGLKAQGPHYPTLVYAIGAGVLLLGLYHLMHRRR